MKLLFDFFPIVLFFITFKLYDDPKEGILAATAVIIVATIVQISTPTEMRGRAIALLSMLAGAAAPLGMGLAGLVYDAIGRSIPVLFAGCGTALVVLSLSALVSRNFRAFLAYER